MSDRLLKVDSLLSSIFSFIGPCPALSRLSLTCKRWHEATKIILASRDVLVDFFSENLKYFDFVTQNWTSIDITDGFRSESPLAVLLAENVITIIDTPDLIIRQFDPKKVGYRTISRHRNTYGSAHPPKLTHFSSAYSDGCIYIAGGRREEDDIASSSVWRFTIADSEWLQMQALPMPLVSSVSAIIRNENRKLSLTVVGSTVDLPTVVSVGFSIELDSLYHGHWLNTAIPPSEVMRFNSRCVVISDHRLIVGMWTSSTNRCQFSLIEFDSFENRWCERHPDPPASYIFPALCQGNVVALAVDHSSRLLSMQYNEQLRQWQVVRHPAEISHSFSLIIGAPKCSIQRS
uniref:F-box domain-containing protein n=1 Tax=Spongospora subterranea TaxID=70186 RepID=A0A0H5R6N8_9EUKA|eukprot:CRZ03954.1 hypothetical protein [Spongospora subterranea]